MKTISAENAESIAVHELARQVLARCDALAGYTELSSGIYRPFLSPAMERCSRIVSGWMEAAGMDVRLDAAGNVRGVYEANLPGAPRLIIGSHLDTVPNAGRYDGIVGVVLGVALVQMTGGRPFGIEIIGFSDEEGVRFGLPFIGSRAIVGMLTDEHRALIDSDGISLGSALHEFNRGHPEAIAAELHPQSRAYLEFHIEQGPVLEQAEQSLGVVDAVVGQSRATVRFHGSAGHAGTTPMAMRRDAMMAAAEWMIAVESYAVATSGLVASTGRVMCEPGATNIIPALVRCSLDVRSADDSKRRDALQLMFREAQSIGTRRNVEVDWRVEVDQPSVPLNASLMKLVEEACASVHDNPKHLVSGAGHDAMILAPYLPSAMIFLRSPRGISHHPDEAVLEEDVVAALRAGMYFLSHFEEWADKGER